MSNTIAGQAVPQETQGQFRARMREMFGDGRNGTTHWRDNPAAQPHIAARKALKEQSWNAQLLKWKGARAVKKAARDAAEQARIDLARKAGSIDEALAILGVVKAS